MTARDATRTLGSATSRIWRDVASSAWFYRLLTLVIGAVAWEVAARSVDSLLIPTFMGTVEGFVQLAGDPELWEALFISNQALVVGFVIALALGIPLGLAIGRFPTLERVTNVYLNILLVAPMAAIIPLLIMSFGLGFTSRVILIVMFAILVMVINARTGVRQIDPKLIEMARSFGASELAIWRRILLPGALPAIMSGIRISIGRAVEGMVIVELLMVSVGIGGLILNFRGRFQGELLYATIVYVIIEAFILLAVARWLEARVTRTVGRPR
jgi:ABC-type nitrate/sulfonate/bicarbonate transport system permease component